MKRASIVATLLAIAVAISACSKHPDDGTAPSVDKPLAPLTIKDDSPDLMLTWIDDKGETHVELRPADVPAAGRSLVRVVVSDREDGTHDLFYVTDLTKKNADGTYATQTMRRREWESQIEKRRETYLARVSPPRPPGAGSPSPDRPAPAQDHGLTAVIIYGASWCGPCHQAADYLKSKGIPYVMKDIEETPGAAAEMQDKLTRAGQRGGGIPVIDVRGQILVGFSAAALDRALARASAGTAL